ncbi:hypothetical protein DACRYDRAFT_96687 [Dacryopinax primogenitus]|uniref:Uncharacterized protein n=1 Tax=Dacryopinax primogenitus (strain DJM 731) TaxID=1858805 RepID=M5FS98_DACPD|nr:uncharacterized protein DACRYDRAFT_96687 [Dacryopinax primogenitus]EJT98039.1 hypothetical protein DACRYDRAFT_96687 [Dacryopinax primogenitus]
MSAPFRTNHLSLNPKHARDHVEDNLEEYVKTAEFDKECAEKARKSALSSDKHSDSSSSEFDSLWSSSESESSVTTVESSPHAPSRIEAHLYYSGIRENGRGPKLIYRDSSDVYVEPTGPEEYKRLMRLVAVPDHHEFGNDGLWEKVRDKFVELLDDKEIRTTCIDFVKFTWLEKKKDGEVEVDEDEGENEAYQDGDRHFSNPTIWVGVAPNTLTADTAFEATKAIRAFLNGLNVTDIDIAYRETVPKSSVSPALFAPVGIVDHRKDFIDPVSVALSLPIAGLKTTMQGTIGPYFHVGNTLYAITVRHNLFLADRGNAEFRFKTSAPKIQVVLMGNPAFTNYLASIQAEIGTLIDPVDAIEKKVKTLTSNVHNGIGLPQSQIELNTHVAEHDRLRGKINALKDFFVDIKKRFGKITQRVIGHVVWAPPIGVGVAPHQYTRDLCVVQLHKESFSNLLGNVLSLGPEYTSTKLKSLLYERDDVDPTFKYPTDGLLALRNILTSQQISNPDNKSVAGDPIRRAIKRGFATNTTVGTISRFMSFSRKYFPIGNMESIESPILSHENETSTFSKGGDSGSTIVSPKGEFISLLTGGTNKGTDGSDITYSTVFEWVWELVREQFPGANLYWDDIPAFLAA